MMNKKKSILLTFILLIVGGLSTLAAENVAKIGETGYETLAEAVAAAKANQTVEIIVAGTYKIPTIEKDITIKGTVDNVIFDCTGTGSIASIPNGPTFEHVTMNFGQNNYHGFQHAGHITMNECNLNGLFYSYGKMDFINCCFNQENEEYNMWVYAGHVTYEGCTFNSKGKFLNIYNEGNDGGKPWKVVAKNCVFNSSKANKAALNIKETCGNKLLRYDVTIDNCTCNEIQKSVEQSTSGKRYCISPIWQVDDRYTTDLAKSLIVVKDAEGNILYEAEKNAPVAKIDDVEYASLAEAVAAVPTDGTETTITMIGDDSYTGTNPIEIAFGKTIILDLNGKTISYVSNNNASDAFITNKGKLTIKDETNNGKITAQQKTNWKNGSYTINNFSGNLVINGGTIENTSGTGLAWPLNNGVYGSTADMVINGGTIHSTNYVPVREYLMFGGTKTITINGGTFVSDNSRAIAVQFTEASVAETNSYVKVNGGTFNCNGSGIFYFDLHANNVNTTGLTFEVTAGSFTNANTESPVVAVDNEGRDQSSAVLPQKFISGGTFSKAPDAKYVAEGYEVVEQDNAFIVQKKQVAKIGETTYASLAEAIAAVKDSETITMIKDVEKAAGISVPSGKKFTVDFGGHSYSVECPGAGSAGTRTQAFQLLQGSTITFKNGTIKCTEANKNKTWTSGDTSKGIAMMIQNYADLTLEDMTIDATNIAHNGAAVRYALSNNSGNVVYSGNTTIETADNDFAFDVCKYGAYDAPIVTWNSTGTINGGIELSGGNFVVAKNLAVSVPVMAAEGESTLEIGEGATLSSSANFNDPNPNLGNGHTTGPVQVKQGAGLTIGGEGTIEGINNAYSAVIVSINGDDDSKTAKLTVNGNVTLQGEYYGIVGNGQRHNTEIVVNGGTIKGVHSQDNVGIFHPQAGKLTINGGAIEGYSSAVEIRGGSITVTGGSLTSTANEFKCNPNGSGNTTVGAALAIAQHTTKKDISVQISGGEFTGVKALNECNPQENDPAPQVTMNVSGGKFKGEVSTVDVKNFLAGGIYSQQPGDAEYLAIGKAVIDNLDVTYLFAVVPLADEVQVAPDLEIAPAEGDKPLDEEQKTEAKEVVNNAITDMQTNKSAILPEQTKTTNTDAVNKSVLTTNQSVGINVEFDGVKVKVETAVSLKELTFDVTPYVVEKVQVGEEEKSVSVKKIENEDIKAPMTFRLPIPSNVEDNCARVIHHKENGEDENMGLYSITKNEEEKYIEISTPSFSKFDIVLENVVAPDILKYYAGGSELIATIDPNAFLNAKATNPNAIAFVESTYASWAEKQTNVVIDYGEEETNATRYVCPKFVLTDLEDFYTPVDFVAEAGSYTRTNTQGLNSVCLPFAITEANVNNGKIGTYKSSNIEDGTGTISFEEVNSVDAGVPCIVDCEDNNDWKIDFENTAIVATPVNDNPMKGSYVAEVIGLNRYKVSSDGTKFVNTVSDSKVFPFRAYLDLTTQAGAKELTIEWNEGSTTGIEEVQSSRFKVQGSVYNLNGMRVNPSTGSGQANKGIVIMNGKKYIK